MMLKTTARIKLRKPRGRQKKNKDNKKKKENNRMTRKERWKRRKNKKLFRKSSKKRRKTEKDKKLNKLDKDKQKNKRSKPKEPRRQLIKLLQLSKRMNKEMKSQSSKKNSNLSVNQHEDLRAMVKMEHSLSKLKKCLRKKTKPNHLYLKVVQAVESKLSENLENRKIKLLILLNKLILRK